MGRAASKRGGKARVTVWECELPWSKEQYTQYAREWRVKHPGVSAARIKERRRQARIVLDELKNKPCADCNRKYHPCVMDFDHVRGVKKYVPTKTSQLAMATLLEEIDKCEVVCSNCHRMRTHNRGTSLAGATKGAAVRWNL